MSGRGLVMWEGLDVAEPLGPGDWVHVSPGVAHWHGAAPDDTFVHLAVTATGGTVWHGPVDDDAYRRALPDGPAAVNDALVDAGRGGLELSWRRPRPRAR